MLDLLVSFVALPLPVREVQLVIMLIFGLDLLLPHGSLSTSIPLAWASTLLVCISLGLVVHRSVRTHGVEGAHRDFDVSDIRNIGLFFGLETKSVQFLSVFIRRLLVPFGWLNLV